MDPINILFLILIFILIFLAIVIIVALFLEKKEKPSHLIGGCESTRYGCCLDGSTGRADVIGSNCDDFKSKPSHLYWSWAEKVAPLLPLRPSVPQTAPLLPLRR